MAQISTGIEAILNINNEHKTNRCPNITVYITTPQLVELKERYFRKIEKKQDSKNRLKKLVEETGQQPIKSETGPLEGKLSWRRKDGTFDYSKKIFLELGTHYAGTSPILTTPFPLGKTIEQTIAYKVMIEESSWIMLYTDKELMGKTQKGHITTTVYIDRRTRARSQ